MPPQQPEGAPVHTHNHTKKDTVIFMHNKIAKKTIDDLPILLDHFFLFFIMALQNNVSVILSDIVCLPLWLSAKFLDTFFPLDKTHEITHP